jgi:hypothetical protein
VCAELWRLLVDEPGITPIDIPRAGRNPFEPFGLGGETTARYFRAASPASIARMRRDVQRFYDANVGRRLGYVVGFVHWTGERWNPTAPPDPPSR